MPASPETSRRRRWRRLALIVFAVLALVATAVAMRGRSQAAAAAVGEPAPLELAGVDLAPVVQADLAAGFAVSGTLEPIRQALLTAEVEGRLQDVLVRAGEAVRAGQVLARMDPRDLANRMAEQRANLAAARAQLALAEKTQRRNEELLARRFISANSVDGSRSNLEASRETVEARQALLALAEQALARAVIRSPIDGVVAERAVEPGLHVGMNARLFSVVDLRELEFAGQVPASRAAALRVGQAVGLAAAGQDLEAVGRVERIAPALDAATRMLPVYVRVANPQGILKGGLVVQGRIRVAEAAGVVAVSAQAIRREGGGPHALVLAGERIERRDLTLGLEDEAVGLVEVKAGLSAGERAVLARLPGLAPGQAATVAAAAARQ